MDKERKYLALCEEGARLFSTCRKRQYYAIIIAPNGRVVGTGYNGSPPGSQHCVDGGCPRAQENSPSGSLYNNCVSNHAEANAIAYSDPVSRSSGTLFVNGTPCWDCAKLIAGAGISKVVCFYDPTYEDWPRVRKHLLGWGVAVREVVNNGSV